MYKQNSKLISLDVVIKLFLCITTLYIGVGYGFYVFTKPKYDYNSPKFIMQQGNIVAQPFMETFENGKVTQFYNWENINKSDIGSKVEPLSIRSKAEQYREYGKPSYKNFLGSLGVIKEAALITPQNYDGKWSLVYCNAKDNFCQKNNINYTRTVKILVDGELELWGVDQSGNYLKLKLEKYIERKEYPDVLFI
jgi:hypothetical protein